MMPLEQSVWAVRIEFTDGTHCERIVRCETRAQAFNLALIDARMGSPAFTFYAPVKSWEATAAEEIEA